jgi:deoxyguanosine kinase
MIKSMKSYFLAIEGPIGVGKTTLARLLQPRLKSELVLEAFEENPFLSDFYADRARYAFQTQMFFLLSRYRQQQAARAQSEQGLIISDYTFAKDSLFAHLNLAGDELSVYQQLYDVLADRVRIPDLVIYLRANTDALMVRIATRDRAYEREMDRDYIDDVRQAYERYFSNYTRTPLLVIDTNDLNYVDEPGPLAFVEGQVRKALGIGAYQRPLPQMEKASASPVQPTTVEWAAEKPRWDAVRAFLAANDALGRVGAALGQGTTGQPQDNETKHKLEEALQEAMMELQSLAHAVEVPDS